MSIGLILLIQAFLTCLITGLIFETFWFSYILFLVFLGGVLVLFIYITSLASNEIFSLSRFLFISFLIILYLSLLFILINDNLLFINIINNEILLIQNLNNLIFENSLNIYKLYNYPTNFITLLLINYLFFTLIIVVKIINFSFGPFANNFLIYE